MKFLKLYLLPISVISLSFATSINVNDSKNKGTPNAKVNPLLTINAGTGGKFSNNYNVKTITIRNGITWSELKNNMPTPTKSGYDIEKWCFTNDAKADAISDDFEFTTDITIYAIWGAGEVSKFATDSWATIIALADRGISALKEAYKDDIAPYGNTFIIQDFTNKSEVDAKTRELYIPNIGTYTVKVIGEGVDKIDGEDNVATLTFEFNELIDTSISYSSQISNKNVYSTSELRNFLNNTFYSRLPSVIKDNTKKVVKTTNDGEGKSTTSTTSDYIFVPSLSEFGIETFDESDVNQNASLENNKYYYYRNNNNSSRVKYITNSSTQVKEAMPYWTRSPYLTDTSKAHVIGNDGSVIDDTNCNVIVGNLVAPCFAVGSDTSHSVTINTNSDTNITSYRSNSYVGSNVYLITYFYTNENYCIPSSLDTDNLKIYIDDVLLENDASSSLKYVCNQENGSIVINNKYVTGNVKIDIKAVSKS